MPYRFPVFGTREVFESRSIQIPAILNRTRVDKAREMLEEHVVGLLKESITVGEEDTLESIAADREISVEELTKLNPSAKGAKHPDQCPFLDVP